MFNNKINSPDLSVPLQKREGDFIIMLRRYFDYFPATQNVYVSEFSTGMQLSERFNLLTKSTWWIAYQEKSQYDDIICIDKWSYGYLLISRRLLNCQQFYHASFYKESGITFLYSVWPFFEVVSNYFTHLRKLTCLWNIFFINFVNIVWPFCPCTDYAEDMSNRYFI